MHAWLRHTRKTCGYAMYKIIAVCAVESVVKSCNACGKGRQLGGEAKVESVVRCRSREDSRWERVSTHYAELLVGGGQSRSEWSVEYILS